MRVLLVGKFYTEGFAIHIEYSLVKMGHSVTRFDPYSELNVKAFKKVTSAFWELYQRSPGYLHSQTKRLQKLINNTPFDLVICCHDFLAPEQVRMIKETTRATIVLWFPDAVSNFGKAMFLVADYDFLFFKDTVLAKRLKSELGLPAYYLPECCNPYLQHPVALTKEDHQRYGCDVSTAGNFHAARMAVLRNLTSYNVKIWGHSPPFWSINSEVNRMAQHHFVAYEEKAKAFLASKIVLNSIHPAEVSGINVRTFEIAAVGAFQLVSYRDDLPDLFDLDRELVCYHSISDLKEKIQYYLTNDELRLQIANRARQRAINDHTYEIRLTRIFQMVAN
jgi:spore maturation protein CgeB